MSSMRPVRSSSTRGSCVDDPVLGRDDDVRQRAGRGVACAAGRATSPRTARRSCCCRDRCSCCPGSSCGSCRRPCTAVPFSVSASPRMLRLPNSCSAMSKPTIATRDTCCLVLPREAAAVLELDRADVLVLRLDAGDARGRGVVGALHLDAAALELGADDGDHRRLGGDRARVVERQEDLAAGALAAGLQAGAAAPDDADVLAELEQHLLVAAPESFAGRRQDDDRDHPPEDAEHREEAAQLVGAQVLERLDDRLRA